MKNIILITIGIMLNMNILQAKTTDYRFMVEQAIKAPSGHNTQPWQFKIKEHSIYILPNFGKALPVVDADNRELFISLGCATENLCLAAREIHYEPIVTISAKGEIEIMLQQTGSTDKDPLFAQIDKRQTNRRVYKRRQIPESVIEELRNTLPDKDGLHWEAWRNNCATFNQLSNYIFQGNTAQMNDTAFTSELQHWMRYNKADSEATHDGLSYAVFGAPNVPKFIAKPVIQSQLKADKQNRADSKKIASSSHLVLISSEQNNIVAWVNLGRFLQRFLLATTAQGIAHAYLNQPCELPALKQQLRQDMLNNKAHPQILLRIGYSEPMPYSKRKSIDEVIIE